MLNFDPIATRFAAAFGSLVVSAFIFATAIAPANQGAILPGVMA